MSPPSHWTLKQIELFSDFSEAELEEVASSLTFAAFVCGDVITHQGAVAHWLYILINGEIDIWFETPNHDRRHLATLSAGRVFGEMGLMTGEARLLASIRNFFRLDSSGPGRK